MTVKRGLQVLHAFQASQAPLSKAELVRRSHLSKATLSRLTSTLIQLGYLRHAPSGREFEMSTALLPIGDAFLHGRALLRRAEPFMQEFADRLNGESFADLESTGVCSMLVGYHRDAYGIALPVSVGRQKVPMALICGAADMEPDLLAARKRIAPELKKAAQRFEQLMSDVDGLP